MDTAIVHKLSKKWALKMIEYKIDSYRLTRGTDKNFIGFGWKDKTREVLERKDWWVLPESLLDLVIIAIRMFISRV